MVAQSEMGFHAYREQHFSVQGEETPWGVASSQLGVVVEELNDLRMHNIKKYCIATISIQCVQVEV